METALLLSPSISDLRLGESQPSSLLPMFSTFLRVLRKTTSIEDFEAALPALEEKALSTPSTLTDLERRLLLDFPDAATEASNLQRSTDLSRDGLISKASSIPADLTDAEITLLQQNFWLDITRQEASQQRKAFSPALQDASERLYHVRKNVHQPNEEQAILNAMMQRGIRMQREAQDAQNQAVQRSMPNLRPWQRRLHQNSPQHWGDVCFISAEAQRTDPARLEMFWRHFDGVIRDSLRRTGAQDVLGSRWLLQIVDEPVDMASSSSSAAVRAKDPPSILSSHAAFRHTFHSLRSQGNALKPGLLTNTFLLIDPTCIDSVLHPSGWLDDMRVLALEADYPEPGKTYADGYEGYTWVRLQHVPFDFYEMRYLHGDDDDDDDADGDGGGERGMQRLWRAAQGSRNRAFVSSDEVEAGRWSTSTGVTGPLEGSYFFGGGGR